MSENNQENMNPNIPVHPVDDQNLEKMALHHFVWVNS